MKKTLLASLLCAVVAFTPLASFAYQANQNTTAKDAQVMTVSFYNNAAEDTKVIVNLDGNGYVASDYLMAGEYSQRYRMPVGSNYCIFEDINLGEGQLHYFKVVANGPYTNNDLGIYGSALYSWFAGNYPNLQSDGFTDAVSSDDIVSLCKNHQ